MERKPQNFGFLRFLSKIDRHLATHPPQPPAECRVPNLPPLAGTGEPPAEGAVAFSVNLSGWVGSMPCSLPLWGIFSLCRFTGIRSDRSGRSDRSATIAWRRHLKERYLFGRPLATRLKRGLPLSRPWKKEEPLCELCALCGQSRPKRRAFQTSPPFASRKRLCASAPLREAFRFRMGGRVRLG